MYFTLIAILGLVVFRKIGWNLSKRFFYPWPDFAAGFGAGIWGSLIAALVFLLIWLFHPNVFLEVIFGWALGAYIAIPNFGLFEESSIPSQLRRRHSFVSTRPLISYLIVASFFVYIAHRYPHR